MSRLVSLNFEFVHFNAPVTMSPHYVALKHLVDPGTHDNQTNHKTSQKVNGKSDFFKYIKILWNNVYHTQ